MGDDRIVPVLLAGGSGTRLWPVSRDTMPKQFLPLSGRHSTYQQALLRVADRDIFAQPLVMTTSDFRFFARAQADELGIDTTVVLEPDRRDSAAAIAAAAVLARARDPQALVLTLAADHVIRDQEAFADACRAGRRGAMAGRIVVFGLPPTEPKTSYGYIKPGSPLGEGFREVAEFVEKPSERIAEQYLAAGYLWNSGNFLFRAAELLDELTRFEPSIAQSAREAVSQATTDLGFVRLAAEPFGAAPRKSIDYAVMEKTRLAAVVEGRFQWSDIGSWDALYAVSEHDTSGNALRGPTVARDCNNCLIYSEGRLTAAVGVSDLIVVATPDAVLVLPRSRAEEIKELVTDLRQQNRPEATDHPRVYRPWGHYERVDTGDRFQVKRIVVMPKSSLSLQRHMHRAEHWVVVKGTAQVTIGDQEKIVHENESTFIPIGCVHRLANPGRIPLELIEVQTGSYLGEDDIVRLEDVYGRG